MTDVPHGQPRPVDKEVRPASRRAQLEALLRARVGDGTVSLSRQQRQMWALDQMHPGMTAYHVPLGYQLVGELKPSLLRRALSGVIARHEALRAVFELSGAQVRQRFLPPGEVELPVVDLTDVGSAAAVRLADEFVRQPFDLATGPVVRATLLRFGPRRHRLLVNAHHIAVDGWSVGLLGRDLSAGYQAPAAGRPDPDATQYSVFCEWQEARLSGEWLERLSSYWQTVLADAADQPPLPTDRPRPDETSFTGAHLTRRVPVDLARGAERLARRLGTTSFVVLLTAYGLALAHLTGGHRINVGTPVANRGQPAFQSTVGLLANTLVLPVVTRPGSDLDRLVRTNHELIQGALSHQEMPLELLVSLLPRQADQRRNPLFDAAFSYRRSDSAGWELPHCRITAEHADAGGAKFDLTLSMVQEPGALTARWEYRPGLYLRSTIESIAERLEVMLAAMIDRTSIRSSDLQAIRVPVDLGSSDQLRVKSTDEKGSQPSRTLIPSE